jgi:type VI secretion system protein
MPLTLSITNTDRLDNGSPLSLVLDRRGATIGRAPTVDWCLPDASLHISSRHCEIQFNDGTYVLHDISTNGTFLRGTDARLPGPHTIKPGDVFNVGSFEISAALDEQTASAMMARNAAPVSPQWKGWDAPSDGAPTPAVPASASGWDAVPTGSAISGTGPMSQSWAPPRAETPVAPPAPAAPSRWDTPAAPTTPASDWSSAVPAQPAAPSTDDVWGRVAASNVVDWARGGFGSPPTPQLGPDLSSPPITAQPVEPPRAVAQPDVAGALVRLLAQTGVDPSGLKQDSDATLAQAGDLLRRLVAGLVVMLEARARAKSQMGAQGTSLEFDGNNPLKFARAPEQALLQLLNPPERGFMGADRAIEDAFRDLQAHQIATLKAMQGALRATLDRFSPTAIRSRADQRGLLKKILPAARDAALWQAYEREFGGVAQGSDEAFMDIFAKEFRKAYEDVAKKV